MLRIGAVVPVLPVALVATVFVRGPQRALSLLEVKSAVLALWRQLESSGARLLRAAAGSGLCRRSARMLTLRRLVVERDGLLLPTPGDLPVLAYYANSVAHLVESAETRPPAEPPAATPH
jgi:glycerol-3-phosphate O-acyltransferase